jgi:hypothetical protein
MTDKVVSLHQWYDLLLKTREDRDIIEEITHRMEAESDSEAARSLAFILATEFRRQARYGDAENIL